MQKRKKPTPKGPDKRHKTEEAYARFVQLVGSSTTSIAETQQTYGVTRGEARYYRQKVAEPTTFHPNSHGGKRYSKWNDEDKFHLHMLIWEEARANPTNSLTDYVRVLSQHGFETNTKYISRLFKQWRWSFTRPSTTQWHKYTTENLAYYGDYLCFIRTIPWGHLKFVDEAHFHRRDLKNRKVIGPTGERHIDVDLGSLNESFSMTLMTTLSPDGPIIYDLREDSNTQYDFLNFICFLIEEGHLVAGDWLVCDNAAVHVGYDTTDMVFDLLEAYGIHLLFLPTYSPELNPCELVFSLIKTELRKLKKSGISLWLATIYCASHVTMEHVVSFYLHSVTV